MRVLLTRPIRESEHVARVVQSRRHEPLMSPVMEIHFLGGTPLALEGVQAIVLTSANGVRALARRTSARAVPAFAVGPQTAEAARAGGFASVEQADGDSDLLVETLRRSAHPQNGALLLVTARTRTGDVDKKLAAAGFTVRVAELYEAVEMPQLSAAAAKALAAGGIDAVMLFSPRSARLFVQQIQSARLEHNCSSMVALCISEATADALSSLQFAACWIAGRPDRDAMLQLLDDAAARLSAPDPA